MNIHEEIMVQIEKIYYMMWKLFIVVIFSHCFVMIFKYVFGHDYMFGIVPLFDMYQEQNVPTYFSSINLLLTSLLLLYVVKLNNMQSGKFNAAWKTLAVGFAIMSIDEFSDLRMIPSRIVKSVMDKKNLADVIPIFNVDWTIPIIIIVIALAIYFIPFLLSLEKKYSMNFIAAGFLFVVASIGFETIQGHYILVSKGMDITFMIMVTLEESIEIISILYFQYILIKYIKNTFKEAIAQ